MAQLLIRNIEPAVIKRLKVRAKLHHRSLQGELKSIVEAATKMSMEEAAKASLTWHKRLAGQTFSDSADLLREDRKR
jgi:plasmid stability protein